MSEIVRMQRFFPTSSERLFDYFFQSHLVQRWMAPAEMTLEVRALDPVPNGRFSFDLRGKEGLWRWEGQYIEIIPNILIELCETGLQAPDGSKTFTNILTKIEIGPYHDGSEITLLQTGFFSNEAAATSEIAWQQRFSYLMGLIDDENSGNLVEAGPQIGVLD